MTPTDREAELNKNEDKKWNLFVKLCGLRRETPEFRRCCFCVPLRRGLVGWGYLKLALNTWAIGTLVLIMVYFLEVEAALIIQILLLLADAAFNVLFIVGGHQKNIKILKIGYIYSFVWLSLMLLVLSWLVVSHDISRVIRYIKEHEHYSLILTILLPGLCVIFSVFVMQIYWILLIRSLLAKLQDHTVEFQFNNLAADAECTLYKHTTSVTDISDTDGPDENVTCISDTDHKPATSVESTSSK